MAARGAAAYTANDCNRQADGQIFVPGLEQPTSGPRTASSLAVPYAPRISKAIVAVPFAPGIRPASTWRIHTPQVYGRAPMAPPGSTPRESSPAHPVGGNSSKTRWAASPAHYPGGRRRWTDRAVIRRTWEAADTFRDAAEDAGGHHTPTTTASDRQPRSPPAAPARPGPSTSPGR